MSRLLAGDDDAFEEFADGYLPALYRFASNRLDRDRELTRDIVQSTLCKAIAKLQTFRGEAALMTWLCACCRSEIAAHFRREKRGGRKVEFEEARVSSGEANPVRSAGPEEKLLSRESAELVHIALDLLPAHYGKALEWKYLEELSVKEIAARLSIGPKAVESLLVRARQSFRQGYGSLVARSPASVGEAGWAHGSRESES